LLPVNGAGADRRSGRWVAERDRNVWPSCNLAAWKRCPEAALGNPEAALGKI